MYNIDSAKTLRVTSMAFRQFGDIPALYTCEGKNINPPIDIESIPKHAVSLAMIVDDPDAPKQTWVHWLVWNIPVDSVIKENSVPGVQGMNDFKQLDYGGPCPPSGKHRYFFKVYALNTVLSLKEGARKRDLEDAMLGHIVGWGELIGLYHKHH